MKHKLTVDIEIDTDASSVRLTSNAGLDGAPKKTGLCIHIGDQELSPDIWIGAGISALLRWNAERSTNDRQDLVEYLRSGKSIQELVGKLNEDGLVVPLLGAFSGGDLQPSYDKGQLKYDYPEQLATMILAESKTIFEPVELGETNAPD